MAKFPSDEWVKEYMDKLNSNADYQDAGSKWEGAITFVILKDDTFKDDAYIYLDLYHGKCREARFSNSITDLPKSEFKYIGSYGNWRRLIDGEIDPIKGILTGKFKLEGAMMKIMRYTRAAKEMVNTASRVQSEF